MIAGKQAIDDDCNQTGQMLAALAGLLQATFANKVEIADGTMKVTREIDGGMETLSMKLPGDHHRPAPERAAVRHAAQHHEGEEKPRGEAGRSGRRRRPAHQDPEGHRAAKRGAGVKGADVDTLVDKLKNEAKVI